MATVKDVWNLLDRKAPFRTQMDFDNAGFWWAAGTSRSPESWWLWTSPQR